LVLPPGYSPAIVERGRDPLEHARRRLVSGVEDGLLLVEDRADRLELALTLEPDRDRAGTLLVLPILAVAVADTLAAHLPPMLPVTLGWPGRVLVDGGLVGRLRLALPPGRAEDRPAWLLLGVSLDIVGPAEEPGRRPDRIGLAETGCSELDPAGLAESLSRHFLSWLDRFETEGFGPVRANWNAGPPCPPLDRRSGVARHAGWARTRRELGDRRDPAFPRSRAPRARLSGAVTSRDGPACIRDSAANPASSPIDRPARPPPAKRRPARHRPARSQARAGVRPSGSAAVLPAQVRSRLRTGG
jgi:hypothetical protein